MNINQDVKRELISSMIRHASKRQAASTTKAARALDKLWRQLFAKHIELKIPEVPQARWAPLIQQGILSPLNNEVKLVTLVHDNKNREVDKTLVGKAGTGYDGSGAKQRDAEEAAWNVVRRAVAQEWGGFLNFTNKRTSSYDFYYSWKMTHADLPHVPGMTVILSPDVPVKHIDSADLDFSHAAYKLSLEVDRLMAAYMDVLKAARAMYDDLTTILMPIRTLKQLQDQFPEALPFLPPEFTTKVKNVKQVADPALINRAKEMLLTGIPN